MEWLLFSYWLPPQPSSNRVLIWRRLKRVGAVSAKGTGWVLPRNEAFQGKIADIRRNVEEIGGTTNLFLVTDYDEAQERQTIATFQEERKHEYAGLMQWCRMVIQHTDRLAKEDKYGFEAIEELEHDLAKTNRWLGEIKERDFCEAPERKKAEKAVSKAEAAVAHFTRETYDRLQEIQPDKPSP